MSAIGVVICDCGKTLFTQEDAAQIASNITCNGESCEHFFHLSALCTEDGITAFTKTVREKELEKLVFAGCSPMQNQNVFEEIACQAGLTPSAVYGVNIKEQGLPHASDKQLALDRTIGSIQKAVNAVSEIPTFETKQISLHQDVLVIGGGIAGISAAREIQRLGHTTILIEQAQEIGGHAQQSLSEESPLPNIDVLTETSLVELRGNVGSFEAVVQAPSGRKTIPCGAIVVASGATNNHSAPPLSSDHAVWLCDLHQALEERPRRTRDVYSVGLVLDLKIDETKASTEMALRMAQQIQQQGKYQAYLFCRDARVAAKDLEERYDEVREAGVNIVKYEGDLCFHDDEQGVRITYADAVLQEKLDVFCHLVGVSPLGISVATDSSFAELVGITTDAYGQLQENNIHLFPEQTNRPGIFAVGACRGQYYIPQILADTKATALEAHTFLAQKTLEIELSNAIVDPDKCALCLTCIRSCPYNAMQVNHEEASAESIPEVCRKCGICAGECPAKAIELPVYSDSVILNYVT